MGGKCLRTTKELPISKRFKASTKTVPNAAILSANWACLQPVPGHEDVG